MEDYLDNYEGIVITVSHDRYFLDRIVSRIFAFEEGGVLCQYEGGYSDYHNRAMEEGKLNSRASFETSGNKVKEENTTDSKETWTHAKKFKFTYKEQKEYETIEDDISAMEERMDAIDEEMGKCARDFVKLNELTKEKTDLETAIEEKMERWAYLEELAAKIAEQ